LLKTAFPNKSLRQKREKFSTVAKISEKRHSAKTPSSTVMMKTGKPTRESSRRERPRSISISK